MALLDLLFPPRCAACAQLLPEAAPMCGACTLAVLELPPERCPTCAQPTGAAARCDACSTQPPPFARAEAAFTFDGAIAAAIPRFKYRECPHLAQPLALLAWPALRSTCEWGDLLAPIPLHARRLRERGFDQALLLADALAAHARLPVDAALLERTRFTSSQVGSSAEERAANLRGAFRAESRARGRRVVLVDDVITTTATAREAAAALMSAGASEVRVVAIARAVSARRAEAQSFAPSGP